MARARASTPALGKSQKYPNKPLQIFEKTKLGDENEQKMCEIADKNAAAMFALYAHEMSKILPKTKEVGEAPHGD